MSENASLTARVALLAEPELEKWGKEFGAALSAPAVVTLEGDLGAGKTTLARAICAGYGVTESVTSPTFALIHSYQSPRSRVFHIDLYRLRNEREAEELGIEELCRDGLVLIEWPGIAVELLPHSTHRIALAHDPAHPLRRRLELSRG